MFTIFMTSDDYTCLYNGYMRNILTLKDVTLISVTSVDVQSAANALLVSSEFISFGSIKLLSPKKPVFLDASIEHVLIQPINFVGYSKFIIENLNNYVNTEFCLIVQADGFIINPKRWKNEFLDYDYIGAPWPHEVEVRNSVFNKFHFDKNRVGNGGFSLRSKRLLEICSQIKFDELNFSIKSEDLLICHFLYEEMLKAGIRFAPLELASQFSIESGEIAEGQNLTTPFGFHGKRWLSDEYLAKLAANSVYSGEFSSLLLKPLVTPLNTSRRIGRLDPCPCGSGRRFKDCHGGII